ncbi:hypothetical protein LZP85_10665 [Priestia flexa]|jgi:hypothetical protein|uniref:Uncharacterized protein n=1 Tax=Priestia flexa TaxID=86664 RepID=A0A1N6QFD5_9BACI|nr:MULTISPECIES: hypothetical protein [Bacillaceae]USY53576.1 hypothetical protein NIZ91_12495 [Bacillus sp. 1780r2a1]MBN8252340.1 hypothetical protein [Priestia flexa]MBN8435849.1 hypothetical protein [Priestia flexa]MBY6085623.1 hypothetical protein [Priestia flexa]MCA0968406.1 hypothetical protein [Priestia flexa]
MKVGDNVFYNSKSYKLIHVYRNGTLELLSTQQPDFGKTIIVDAAKVKNN